MRNMHSATSIILTAALALISCAALAKPPQPYHVEVIIFERGAASSQLEYWPDNIKLSYPADVVFITPTQNTTDSATTTQPQDLEPPQASSTGDFLDPRILPERSQKILNSEASKLARRYRVLFHKAWQQTFTATDKAPSVIISGGDTFDNRSELGGSVRLSINKFIHVDTDLWLTKFSPNLGQTQQWPMPPLSPKPRIYGAPKEESTWQASQYEAPKIGINAETLDSAGGDKYRFDANSVLTETYALSSSERFNFLPQIIYPLKQSRRMRSKELHYIDHPRFGIVLRIDPISFEEVISKQ